MRGDFQPVVPPLPYIVKRLIILNLAIWVGLVLVLQKMILQSLLRSFG